MSLNLKKFYRLRCCVSDSVRNLAICLCWIGGSVCSLPLSAEQAIDDQVSQKEVADRVSDKKTVTESIDSEESSNLPPLERLKEFGFQRSRFRADPSAELDQARLNESDVLLLHEKRLTDFPSKIAPVLQQRCGDCHSGSNAEGNFQVDQLDPDLVNGKDTDWWIEVFAVVSKGEMPPADAEPLEAAEQKRLVDWVSGELQIASSIRSKTQRRSSFRRLTRYEYNYALQDLLGVNWDFASDLPPEAQSEDGFVNRSEQLHLSVMQFEMYYQIARRALRRVVVKGSEPKALHWLITADQLAAREWASQAEKRKKLEEEHKDNPEELKKRLEELEAKFSQRPRGAHYEDKNTGRFASTQWQYYNAKYAFAPSSEISEPPASQGTVAVLPSGQSNQLIFELGDQLPDEGTMRVTAEVAQLNQEGDAYPSLQLLFGWQASNEGRALLVVSEEDTPVTGTLDEPQIIQWDISLGEIYPRNSVRKASPMGATPSPSEYIRIVNSSASPTSVQVRYVAVSSPVHDQWPPATHQSIFSPGDGVEGEEERARLILGRFMNRAWRGNVLSRDVDQKVDRFLELRPSCDSFEEAITEVLAIVLSSPRFLYVSVQPVNRTERSLNPEDDSISKQSDDNKKIVGNASPDQRAIGIEFSLAERLAMFLWCSLPDEELLNLAADGSLRDPDVLNDQIERMIQDKRVERFVTQFARQWLNLELLEFQNFKSHIPGFDPLLKEAMLREPIEFLGELLRKDGSILDLLHCDYAMVNERLALHYGLQGVRGNHFRRVLLPGDASRGGLMTQAGFLAMNSDWPDSHPLKRSIWLLERLLNDPPPPPPPAVPQIDLADPRIAKMTLKERIEDHRNQAACASCHVKIDPWGIAFENYDALGKWRDTINGREVDASSVLFNGDPLDGIDGLKRFLLINRQDQLVQAVIEKLLAYSLGRSLTFADQNEVEQIVRRVRRGNDGLQECILAIVRSELFLKL